MKLTHISIGKAEPLKANPEVVTGLYKRPVEGPVRIGTLGTYRFSVEEYASTSVTDGCSVMYSHINVES